MPDFRLATPTTLPSPNGFSHVAILDAGQRLVWTSGQVALTPDGELIGPADWEAQTRAVMRNLTVALDAGGATWQDVFKLTIHLRRGRRCPGDRSGSTRRVHRPRPPADQLARAGGRPLPTRSPH